MATVAANPIKMTVAVQSVTMATVNLRLPVPPYLETHEIEEYARDEVGELDMPADVQGFLDTCELLDSKMVISPWILNGSVTVTLSFTFETGNH